MMGREEGNNYFVNIHYFVVDITNTILFLLDSA